MHKTKKTFGTKDAPQIRGLTSANLASVQGGVTVAPSTTTSLKTEWITSLKTEWITS